MRDGTLASSKCSPLSANTRTGRGRARGRLRLKERLRSQSYSSSSSNSLRSERKLLEIVNRRADAIRTTLSSGSDAGTRSRAIRGGTSVQASARQKRPKYDPRPSLPRAIADHSPPTRATAGSRGSATHATRSLHWEETLLPGVVPGANLDS